MTKTPDAFVPGQGGGYRPAPVQVSQSRAYNAMDHLPPPVDLLPTLTVNSRGRVYLSKALVLRLGIRDAQPANLLPPSNGSPYWHLDLRPKARRYIKWYENTRPRIEFLQLPDGLVAAATPLVLCLLAGEPEFPGFYPMLPAHAQPTHR